MSQRTNFISLPDIHELKNIIAAEARRPVFPGKEAVHYPDFTPILALLNHYGINDEFFSAPITFADIENRGLIDTVNACASQTIEKILADTSPPHTILDAMYEYLSEEDKPEPANIIMVFGAKTPTRIGKAVELYKSGLAPLICISGGHPFYGADAATTEAEIYKQYAMQHGIPETAIITENKSITIPDNVWRTLSLLEAKSVIPTSIILVNSPYVQRRGWTQFRKYTSDSTKLFRVNATTIDTYSKSGWYMNADGIKVIFNEFAKMRISVSLNTA